MWERWKFQFDMKLLEKNIWTLGMTPVVGWISGSSNTGAVTRVPLQNVKREPCYNVLPGFEGTFKTRVQKDSKNLALLEERARDPGSKNLNLCHWLVLLTWRETSTDRNPARLQMVCIWPLLFIAALVQYSVVVYCCSNPISLFSFFPIFLHFHLNTGFSGESMFSKSYLTGWLNQFKEPTWLSQN